MPSIDLKNNIVVETTISPAARTASEAGATIDLNGFQAATIEIIAGTINDGTHSVAIEESNDGTTWANTNNLQGSLSNVASNTNQQVGYIGHKRYIRANVTVSGATTGGTYAAVVVKGAPKNAPV